MRKADIERMVGQKVTFRRTNKWGGREEPREVEIVGYGYSLRPGLGGVKRTDLTEEHFEQTAWSRNVLVRDGDRLSLMESKDLDIRPLREVLAERADKAEAEKQERLRAQRFRDTSIARAEAVCRWIGINASHGHASYGTGQPVITLGPQAINELIAKHGLDAPEYEEQST